MKKRLAILTVTVAAVLGAAGSAFGAMHSPGPNPNGPSGAGCPGADLTCKM